MKIQLFLQHITQERFPIDMANNWNGNVWSVPCCVLNFGARIRKEDIVLPIEHRGFALRKESEGGILWDPVSNSVYTVDDEAYNALVELGRGLSEKEVARRLGTDHSAVKDFVRTLEEIQRPRRTKER